MTQRNHIYRGICVRDTNERGDVYDVRVVVLVDDHRLPMSGRAKQKSPTGLNSAMEGPGQPGPRTACWPMHFAQVSPTSIFNTSNGT
jgi:hypothetical protein